MTSFFSAEGGPIWIKFRRLVHVDCDELKTRCRIPIWWTFGRNSWHVIPEPPATLQAAVTWRNQCHDRATLYGVIIPSAILNIVFRHIFFVFNAVWALTSGGFRIVSDTLVTREVSRGGA